MVIKVLIDLNKLNNDNISFIYRIKNAFITRLNKFTSNEYLYAFILGDKNYIDSDTYEKFSNNGVTHLFAVSGMHVSFLVLAIEFFLIELFKDHMHQVPYLRWFQLLLVCKKV